MQRTTSDARGSLLGALKRPLLDLDVVAESAVEDVGSGSADQHVIVVAAQQHVVALAPDEHIGAEATVGGELDGVQSAGHWPIPSR